MENTPIPEASGSHDLKTLSSRQGSPCYAVALFFFAVMRCWTYEIGNGALVLRDPHGHLPGCTVG